MYDISIQSYYVVIGTIDQILVYSLKTNELIVSTQGMCICLNLMFSVICMYLLGLTPYFIYSGHEDGIIRVWRLETLEYLEMMTGHEDVVKSLTFNDQGILSSASSDGSVKKWDIGTRRVAFSYKDRSQSVTCLAAVGDSLAVGMNAGGVTFYDINTGIVSMSSSLHSQTVTSLIVMNGSFYSASLDGSLVQDSAVVVFNDSSLPIKSITYSNGIWYAIRGESSIWGLKQQSKLVSNLNEALTCITATATLLIVGTKGGDVVGMDVTTGVKLFTLTDHTSQVNAIVTYGDDYVFSASDDKTIMKHSLSSKEWLSVYVRISTKSLGHLGPVNAISVSLGTLFSVGSDLTTRRWNIESTKHEDVYFGHLKIVTAVICYNATVFSFNVQTLITS